MAHNQYENEQSPEIDSSGVVGVCTILEKKDNLGCWTPLMHHHGSGRFEGRVRELGTGLTRETNRANRFNAGSNPSRNV